MALRQFRSIFGWPWHGGCRRQKVTHGAAVTVEGCPQAVEMFEGNVGDPSSLASQVREAKERFQVDRRVTFAALRAPAVRSPGGRRTRMCKQVCACLPYRGDSHDKQHDDYT
jgi:hypothetical protein